MDLKTTLAFIFIFIKDTIAEGEMVVFGDSMFTAYSQGDEWVQGSPYGACDNEWKAINTALLSDDRKTKACDVFKAFHVCLKDEVDQAKYEASCDINKGYLEGLEIQCDLCPAVSQDQVCKTPERDNVIKLTSDISLGFSNDTAQLCSYSELYYCCVRGKKDQVTYEELCCDGQEKWDAKYDQTSCDMCPTGEKCQELGIATASSNNSSSISCDISSSSSSSSSSISSGIGSSTATTTTAKSIARAMEASVTMATAAAAMVAAVVEATRG